MTVRIEIGIDSVMPEILAPFWADALGYESETWTRAGNISGCWCHGPGLAGRLPASESRNRRQSEPPAI